MAKSIDQLTLTQDTLTNGINLFEYLFFQGQYIIIGKQLKDIPVYLTELEKFDNTYGELYEIESAITPKLNCFNKIKEIIVTLGTSQTPDTVKTPIDNFLN